MNNEILFSASFGGPKDSDSLAEIQSIKQLIKVNNFYYTVLQ